MCGYLCQGTLFHIGLKGQLQRTLPGVRGVMEGPLGSCGWQSARERPATAWQNDQVFKQKPSTRLLKAN